MLLTTIHFLHIATGIVWAGGTALWVFAIVPALTRLEPDVLRSAFRALRPMVSILLNVSGLLLIVSGLARLYFGGGVTSLEDLADPYAIHALVALAILIGLAVVEGRFQTALTASVETPGDPRPAFRRIMRPVAALTGAGLATIFLLMTALGLGLY